MKLGLHRHTDDHTWGKLRPELFNELKSVAHRGSGCITFGGFAVFGIVVCGQSPTPVREARSAGRVGGREPGRHRLVVGVARRLARQRVNAGPRLDVLLEPLRIPQTDQRGMLRQPGEQVHRPGSDQVPGVVRSLVGPLDGKVEGGLGVLAAAVRPGLDRPVQQVGRQVPEAVLVGGPVGAEQHGRVEDGGVDEAEGVQIVLQ